MDRSDARVKFQDADRLFQSRQYAAALDILNDLDRQFPGERHILYPIARCLSRMKRYSQAREIAIRLVEEFDYLPAQELVDRIDRHQSTNDDVVETPVLPSGLDNIVVSAATFGAKRRPGDAKSATSDTWQSYAMWIGIAIGAFGLSTATGATVGQPFLAWLEQLQVLAAEGNHEISDIPPVPWSAFASVAASNILCAYVLACFTGYWSLKVVEGLRFHSFGENMKDVAVTALIGQLLSVIILIGWIIFLVILKKRHELTIGRLFGAVLLYGIFNVMLSVPVSIAYNILVRGAIV